METNGIQPDILARRNGSAIARPSFVYAASDERGGRGTVAAPSSPRTDRDGLSSITVGYGQIVGHASGLMATVPTQPRYHDLF